MIFLVRHGQTELNKNGFIQGITYDPSLDQVGRDQAEKLARSFKDVNFDLVISSPLKRAKETADILTKHSNVKKFIIDNRFIERDYGILDGQKTPAPDFSFYYLADIKEAEKPNDLYSRINKTIKELCSNKDLNNILIVSHGALIGSFIYNRTNDKSFTLKNTTCAVIDSKTGNLIDYNLEGKELEKYLVS